MAGLFGSFFNYDKEGPGVEKDAPEKKGFIIFFLNWRYFFYIDKIHGFSRL